MKVMTIGAAALLAMAGGPALATVKDGVDAWQRGDFPRAVSEWRGPAAAGDADAQFNIGQAYKLGRGVPTDETQAIDWFRKAALQGHAQAQDNYALALFQQGRKSDAVPWLEKSVARDEKRTELVLGTMLFNGDAVQKDWVRAYALVTRSSQQGLAQASQTLTQMDQYIGGDERERGMAMAARIESDARARRIGFHADGPAALELPPSPPVQPARAARPAPLPLPPTSPSRSPSPSPSPVPAPAASSSAGGWRIQLGAFRNEENARTLWAKVGAKTGGTVRYVPAGALTRLVAGGFASRAGAQAACAKAGVPCVVVGP